MSKIEKDDLSTRKCNMLYYDKLVMNERKAKLKKNLPKSKKKYQEFATQKVDFNDLLHIPENWAAAFYLLYGVGIPYIVGAIFLFFFIAGASYENFKLLNMSAFLIIWLIGYEIVAVFSLIWIFILYLRYDSQEEYC